MADKRITELTTLTGVDLLDLVEIVDISETNIELKNKKVTVGELINSFVKYNNFDALAAPTVTDDETKFYSRGSFLMHNDNLYVCFDPTTGAAKWKGFLLSEFIS